MTIDSPSPESHAVIRLGDHDNPSHIMCAKCREIKSKKEFIKKATPAQSRSWGRAGNVAMEVVSKFCSVCRPRHKTFSERTPKDMERHLDNGNTIIPLYKAEAIYHRRVKEGKDKIRDALKRRRYEPRGSVWDALRATLIKKVDCMRATRYRARNGYPPAERIPYADYIYALGKKYIGVIKHNRKCMVPINDIEFWESLITPQEAAEVLRLYAAIPEPYRHRMGGNSVLNMRILQEKCIENGHQQKL